MSLGEASYHAGVHLSWLRPEVDFDLYAPWPRPIADRLRALPRSAVVLVCAAVTLLVGAADTAVAEIFDHDFVFTALYLVPVGLTAWAVGRRAGFGLAIFAAAAEAASTALSDPSSQGHAGRLAVAVGLELIVFFGAAHVLAALRTHLDRERELSRTDPVTGIPNRRAFCEVAAVELERARRRGTPVSLAFLDVDDFKRVNDTKGHAAGDLLLRLIAVTLQSSVRATDVVARLGGDEFAVLLPDAEEAACRAVFGRLLAWLGPEAAQHGFDVTFSAGVTIFQAAPVTLEELVEAADRVMYGVKHGSKDGIRYQVVEVEEGERLRKPA
jgi:diguanylate cyclase (GGDEF)-like protein